MNIFISDPDPSVSASVLDDRRVIKMILESVQLMSTAINCYGGKGTYKSTHINHPCSIWTRQSLANYYWLWRHYISLSKEYFLRFGKIHKCFDYWKDLCDAFELIDKNAPMKIQTPFMNCTIFKDDSDTINAYRKALNHKWNNDKISPKWTNSKPPEWKISDDSEIKKK
jgi:hypothetical protein